MGLGNSRALEIAGVDADTPDVAGGEIVRDDDGRPTGVLKDNALRLAFNAMPAPTDAQMDRYLDASMRYLVSNKDAVGSWYNTQATMNALRALLAAASPQGSDAAGTRPSRITCQASSTAGAT